MNPTYVPERGDVVWIHADPQAGHERAGRRPALVVSPAAYNGKVGLGLFCPITTQVKGYPFEVPIPGDVEVSGVVLSDQIESLDWRARRADFLDRVPESVLNAVLQRVATLIHPGV